MSTFLSALERFSETTILVVGDAMLDIYTSGTSTRMMPEAPEAPVVLVGDSKAHLGGAANVAANVAALGGKVRFLCLTGRDVPRELMLELAAEKGLPAEGFIADDTRPTIAKERMIADGRYVARVDREKTHDVSGAAAQALQAAYREGLDRADAVILSDYCKGTLSEPLIRYMIEAAQEKNIPVLVDSKKKNWAIFAGALAAKPNMTELAARTGDFDPFQDAAVVAAARQLMNRCGLPNMIASRSERGVSAVTADTADHFPATAQMVREVSGAGDTLMAACALAIGAGVPFRDAVWIGNLAAGIAVEKSETVTVSKEELTAAMIRWEQTRKTA